MLTIASLEFSCGFISSLTDKSKPDFKKIDRLWLAAITFVAVLALGAVDLILPWLKHCSSFGARECLQEVFFAHTGSEFKGLRLTLSATLGLSLCYCMSKNPKTIEHAAYSIAAGSVVTLIVGLRHVPGLQDIYTSLPDNYYTTAFLKISYFDDYKRAFSLFGNPGWYGQYLLFIFPIWAYFFFQGIKNKQTPISVADPW